MRFIAAAIIALSLGCHGVDGEKRAAGGDAGAGRAAASIPDAAKLPCGLLSREEVQTAVGYPVADPLVVNETECLYSPQEQRRMSYTNIEMHWKDGREELEAARSAIRIVTRRVEKDAPEIDPSEIVDGETVPALADDAFFSLAGVMPFLYVRKGDVAFTIEGYGETKEQMIAVARVVVAKLP